MMGRTGLILLTLLFMLFMVHARLQPLQNALTKENIQSEDKIVRDLNQVQGEPQGENNVKSVIKKGGGGGGGGRGGGGGGRSSSNSYSRSYNNYAGNYNSYGHGSKVNEGTTVVAKTGGGGGGQSPQDRGKHKQNGANISYVGMYWWIFASLATLCIV